MVSNVTAIAFGAPLFYLFDVLSSSSLSTWWSTATYLSPSRGRAILPAMLLGYLVPSLLMFTSVLPSHVRQWMAILWMFAPVHVVILQRVFARAYFQRIHASVRSLYTYSFLICAGVHWWVILSCINTTQTSLLDVFAFKKGSDLSVEESNHNMFLWDFYITFDAGLLWAFASWLDLSRTGISGKTNMLKVAFYMGIGTLLAGPAAVLSAGGYYRAVSFHDDSFDSLGEAEHHKTKHLIRSG